MSEIEVGVPIQLPRELRGEQCSNCGTKNNIVWFTDNTFWNEVIRAEGSVFEHNEPALCIPCFVTGADVMGFRPTGWRLLPEWPIRRTKLS